MANEFIIKNGFVSKGNSIVEGILSGQTFNIINTPVNNNSATEILVRNTTTGDVEYRNSSTLGGGGGGQTITGYTYDETNNTFSIGISGDTSFDATIDIMSGLTINGDLTVNGEYSLMNVDEFSVSISGDNVFSVGQLSTQDVKVGELGISDKIDIGGDEVIIDANTLNLNQTLSQNNTETQLLVRNSTTGNVEYRDSSSISGGSSTTNVFVNSGNADVGTQQLTFTNTTGGTFNVTNSTALFSNNDINVTGGTYDVNTGCVTFGTNSGTTFDICGFVTGLTDTFTTGGTYNNTTGEITFTKTDNSTYDVDLSSISGGTVYWIEENNGLKSNISSFTGSINGTSTGALIAGGASNNEIFSGFNSTIINGSNNIISGSTVSAILSSQNSSINSNPSAIDDISQATIVGGLSNTIEDTTLQPSERATIVGGSSNIIDGGLDSSIIGGSNNIITQVGSGIYTSRESVISGGSRSAIVGGAGNIIDASYSVILGGQNIIGTTNNTVYVPNLNIDTIGSGTPLINLGLDSNGNVVTGTTTGGGSSSTITGYTYDESNNTFSIGISGGTSLDTTINVVSGLTVTNDLIVSGNTGMGTDNPLEKLDVRGDILISHPSNNSVLTISATSTNDSVIDFDNTGVSTPYARIEGNTFGGGASGNLQFYTYPTGGPLSEVMILTSNQRVGIGNILNNDVSEKLHVSGGDILVETSNGKFYTDLDAAIGPQLRLSGNSADLILMGTTDSSINGSGVGTRGETEPSFPGYGKQGDGFLYSSSIQNGLNIISQDGINKEDYIRFYAGKDANGTTPDIHIQGTGTTLGNVGIGTINPSEKLHVSGEFVTINTGGAFKTDLNSVVGPGIQLSGGSIGLPRVTVVDTPNSSSLTMGVRGWSDVLYPGYGEPGDGFIYSSDNQNGLNILSTPGSGTDDYIRFYAGKDAVTVSPSIHIQGSGTTKGNVGINTTIPTERLHVDGSVRVVGNSILHSDGVESFPLSGISKGQYTEFNWDGITSGIISNSATSGNSSYYVGDFSTTTNKHGSIRYYGSGYTRSDNTSSTGDAFYQNKVLIAGGSEVDGMVIKPKTGDGNGTLWFEVNGSSVAQLFGDSGYFGLGLNTDGTEKPSTHLQVGGTGTTGSFKFLDGNEQNGYVLTCDSNGVASWQPSSGGTSGGTVYWTEGGSSNDSILDTKGGQTINGASINSIIAGGESNLITEHDYSGIFAGSENKITGSTLFNATGNVIVGGNSNSIGTTLGWAEHNSILGGTQNTIDGRAKRTTIIGGVSNSILSSLDDSSIIGGNSNEVKSYRSVVLGGANMTATTTNDTVYVPKLNVRDIGSGTPLINLGLDSNGFVVTGSTGSGSTFSWSDPVVTSGNSVSDCISDLYVSNLHSCSPLHINPLDEGNVYFGSLSGFTVDLSSDVNIGVGTNSPLSKLHINNGNILVSNENGSLTLSSTTTGGGGNYGNNLYFRSAGSIDYDGAIKSLSDGSSGSLRFLTTPTTGILTEHMILTSRGRLGIGTEAPDSSIHISGDSRQQINIESQSNDSILKLKTSDSNDSYIQFEEVSGTRWLVGSYNVNNPFVWTTGSTLGTDAQMGLTTAGNLGVGNITPETRLHVNNNNLPSIPTLPVDNVALFESDNITDIAIIGDSTRNVSISLGDEDELRGKIIYENINDSLVFQADNTTILGLDSSTIINYKPLELREFGTGTPTFNLQVKETGFGGYVVVTGATGGDSGNCITDLWVTNLESCSPLNINTQNQGNVYVGDDGGLPKVTIDITTPNESSITFDEESFMKYKKSQKELIIGEPEGGGKVKIEVEGSDTFEVSKTETSLLVGDFRADAGNVIIKSGNGKTLIIEDIPDVSGANLGTDIDGKVIDLPSDSRTKHKMFDLTEVVDPLVFLNALKPQQFEYKPQTRISSTNKKHYGFKVDDFRDNFYDGSQLTPKEETVNIIAKTFVRKCKTKFNIDSSGNKATVDSMNYVDLIPFMVSGINQLNTNLNNINSGGGKKFVQTLTLGSGKTTITHNLNDVDVIVQVVEVSTGQIIIPDNISNYTSNSVDIYVEEGGEYKIIIIG